MWKVSDPVPPRIVFGMTAPAVSWIWPGARPAMEVGLMVLAALAFLSGNVLALLAVLVGLGVRELSMNAAAIPQAKAVIRQIERGKAETLAKAALALSSTEEVRGLNLAP